MFDTTRQPPWVSLLGISFQSSCLFCFFSEKLNCKRLIVNCFFLQRIRIVDYEKMVDSKGQRVCAFGKFAGVGGKIVYFKTKISTWRKFVWWVFAGVWLEVWNCTELLRKGQVSSSRADLLIDVIWNG